MAKISVIVAAYNVDKYIADALNSVVAQTLKDIEIIVVDDCSTDKTLEIIEKIAELDKRIKLVKHETNKSLMQVRQTGFINSSGEYIMFLDGDDMLKPDACQKAYDAVVSENVDLLQYDFEPIILESWTTNEQTERELRFAMSSVDHKVISVSPAGLLDEKAIGGKINLNVWNKIYSRNLLEKANKYIPNEYLNMAEDVMYSYLILYHARSFGYINDRLYMYRYGCGMSTTVSLTDKQVEFIAKNAYVYNYLKTLTSELGVTEYCEYSLKRVFNQLFDHMLSTFFFRLTGSRKNEFINIISRYVTKNEIVLAMCDYVSRGIVSNEEVALQCSKLDIFKADKTDAKTIGVYYYRMYNGGIEKVISALTDIWVNSGFNVVVFTDEEPNKDDYSINPAAKRVVVPIAKNKDYFSLRERIDGFTKEIIDNNIDIMVYNAWINPDIVYDELIIKSCGVNLMIHTHNLFCCETDNEDPRTVYFFATLPQLYKLADSVISLTDVDDAWWNMMGVKSFKTINPIQFSLDVDTSNLEGNNILFVARIDGSKQVLDAIKIAERVHKEIPDAVLTIVGKGDDAYYVKSVNDYIANNKLEKVVNMAGFHSEMLPFYHNAAVMLATSRFEGFGLALMEGKICGVPLVTYELPNLDITRASEGMVVVDQSDIEGAANAIIKILSDDDLKRTMGQQARKSAEEFFCIDLSEHWKMMFEKSLENKNEEVPVYKLPAKEAAVRIVIERYKNGIYKRGCARDLSGRVYELEHTLEEFKRSESYRIGMIITFIPRKIKALLKKIFKREK